MIEIIESEMDVDLLKKHYRHVLYVHLNSKDLYFDYLKHKKEGKKLMRALSGNGWIDEYRNIQANARKMLRKPEKKRYNGSAARSYWRLTKGAGDKQ